MLSHFDEGLICGNVTLDEFGFCKTIIPDGLSSGGCVLASSFYISSFYIEGFYYSFVSTCPVGILLPTNIEINHAFPLQFSQYINKQ